MRGSTCGSCSSKLMVFEAVFTKFFDWNFVKSGSFALLLGTKFLLVQRFR